MNHYEISGGMHANRGEPSEVGSNEAEVGFDVEGYRQSNALQIEGDGENVAEEGLYGSGMQTWGEQHVIGMNEAEVGFDVEGYRQSNGLQIEGDGDNVAEEGLYGSGLHTWGEQDVIGMGFDTVAEAENFYTMYAQAIGFGVRNSSTVYNRQLEGTKQLVGKLFVCCCEGQRDPKWCDIDSRKRQPKALTRTNCKAKMRVKLDTTKNKWVISQFQAEHNHELVCGKEQSFIRANRHVDEGYMAEAIAMKESGVQPTQCMNYFVNRSGGHHNVPFTRTDLFNSLNRHSRDQVKHGDAETCINFFRHKSVQDDNFFFQYTTDEDCNLDKLIWCDSKCRMDYAAFGDVIAFDTTYKKNAYNLPLFCLIGLNNHNQTTPFAFALLSEETTAAYKWVLETFMTVMGNKKPVSVVTDGALPMHNALYAVIPEARHRLCVWHLEKNANENVKVEGFLAAFKTVMMSWWTVDEFELAWTQLVQLFKLDENRWIAEKYRTKELWAQAYLTGTFFGTLRTTSRCEGLHSYLKKYIKSSGTLFEFLHSIDRALANIRNNELQSHYLSKHTHPVPSNTSCLKAIEEHAAIVYTRAVFEKVMTELKLEHDYSCTNGARAITGGRAYKLTKYMNPDREICLTFMDSTQHIYCSCRKFETEGISCRHSFNVMKMENLVRIPPSLIMRRWTIDAINVETNKHELNMTDEDADLFRRAYFHSHVSGVCDLARKSREAFQVASRGMELLYVQLQQLNTCEDAPSSSSIPQRVGDPRNNQGGWQAKIHGGSKQISKNRCSYCGIEGHKRTTCPRKQMEQEKADEVAGLSQV